MGFFDFLKKKPVVTSMPAEQKNDVREAKTYNQSETEGIPTLESRIRSSFPSANGLYPHEILMLSYAASYKISGNSFQNFWKWNYSVLEPQKILDSLYQRGFLCMEESSQTLKRMVVPELKKLLSQVGEKTTGKKDEMIERILGVYQSDELEKLLPDKHFALTEKGKAEVKKNEYVLYLHRERHMSVWEMNVFLNKDNPSHQGYRDIIWREYNKQSLEHFKNYNFGLYRNTRYNMHSFLLEEKKYKTAFQLLCEVISFDLSGLGNGDDPNNKYLLRSICEMKLANFIKTEDEKEIVLASGVIKSFEGLYKELKMSSEDFIKHTYDSFSEIRIHDRVFSENECANLILSEIGLENKKINNSYQIAQKRIREKFGP